MNDINTKLAADTISASLGQGLSEYIGSPVNKEAIQDDIDRMLQGLVDRKMVTPDFKVGDVYQLWESWSIKQKVKWIIYNKMPILRSMSEQIRKEIQDYNTLVYVYQESLTGDQESQFSLKELPDHLTCSPKTIMISNIMIKPIQSVDFININIDLADTK